MESVSPAPGASLISEVPPHTRRRAGQRWRILEDETEDSSISDSKAVKISSNNSTVKEQHELCTPVGECELCPTKWKSLLDIDENGEYESCVSHGRRRQFECTTLFQESGSSEKRARSRREYRPCLFTEADEEFRMLRLQIICLLIGMWSLRTVRRQKVASASLFDQRRMMRHHGSGNGSNSNNPNNSNAKIGDTSRGKYSVIPREDSMETIELSRNRGVIGKGIGKVPKSPAPNLQTV